MISELKKKDFPPNKRRGLSFEKDHLAKLLDLKDPSIGEKSKVNV